MWGVQVESEVAEVTTALEEAKRDLATEKEARISEKQQARPLFLSLSSFLSLSLALSLSLCLCLSLSLTHSL